MVRPRYSNLPLTKNLQHFQDQSLGESGVQRFTARRSAGSTLPTFVLPPPRHLSAIDKFPAYTTQPTNTQQKTAVSTLPALDMLPPLHKYPAYTKQPTNTQPKSAASNLPTFELSPPDPNSQCVSRMNYTIPVSRRISLLQHPRQISLFCHRTTSTTQTKYHI